MIRPLSPAARGHSITCEVIEPRRFAAHAGNNKLVKEKLMTGRLIVLVTVLIGFSALTALALRDHGYWGIIQPHFQSWGGAQVFTDLVILALLACIWMVQDARRRGVNVWPYLAITLAAGSFGPLLYLAVREWKAKPE
jgi:uncharacterized membrane protein YqjE